MLEQKFTFSGYGYILRAPRVLYLLLLLTISLPKQTNETRSSSIRTILYQFFIECFGAVTANMKYRNAST